MSEHIVHIRSISQLHETIGYGKPKHPLISVIDVSDLAVTKEMLGVRMMADLYQISIKDKSCGMEYGRNHYDFDEGVLMFTAPRQVMVPTEEIQKGQNSGWMLVFHPDLIRNTHLGASIDDFSFFNYDVFEALHLSEDEEKILLDCFDKIKQEYSQRIDKHSQRVIVSNIELLLNYSLRFYERQFNTRTSKNKDIVSDFEKEIKQYFNKELHLENGIPSIQYFAEKANLSPHYFSDLLKKETGRSAKDHINDFIIEKAKNILVSSKQSVSEIAYDLGFNYPHYFTRLFKSKTGQTPHQYRTIN